MPVVSFATLDDLMLRWKDLDEAEAERAVVMLGDASAMLLSMLDSKGVKYAGDVVLERNLKAIVCSMVQRAMTSASDVFGVTQASQTAGPYSQSFTYANPNGDLYVTKSEMRLIGLNSQKGRFYMPYGKADD